MIKRICHFLLGLFDKVIYLLSGKKEFVLLSNNCWGFEYYNNISVTYNHPFIGCYIAPSQFYQLISNLNFYMDGEFGYSMCSDGYPVVVINNEIVCHFIHEVSVVDLKSKFERRLLRLKRFLHVNGYNNVKVKICDRDGMDDKLANSFESLDFSILLLTKDNLPKICLDKNANTVVDGRKLFDFRLCYLLRLYNFLK
ncbi:DUF1919 domain-containing protein [Vibrio harveyi]|uniref:DUF1919 domain-containing protein n=1 Tax=Vibrio harveyi TaxID=669 RepID=UPI000C7D782C|nr:DUF1919 domain-containing protein [Vibrio harveyi]